MVFKEKAGKTSVKKLKSKAQKAFDWFFMSIKKTGFSTKTQFLKIRRKNSFGF